MREVGDGSGAVKALYPKDLARRQATSFAREALAFRQEPARRRLWRQLSCCGWERQDGLVGRAPHYLLSGAWSSRSTEENSGERNPTNGS